VAGAFRDSHHRLRQPADRLDGVWSPSGQARASGDCPEQFKVSCGQWPIVMDRWIEVLMISSQWHAPLRAWRALGLPRARAE
jgi:hypothetical protein